MDKKPTHVGFIMDGNRRWAKENGVTVFQGHKAGSKVFNEIVEACQKEGIKYITFYAFSTENWNRSQKEIIGLMKLFTDMKSNLKKCMDENIKFRVIGELSKFNNQVRKSLEEVIDKTKGNTGMTINLALNYGGRSEIVRSVKKCIEQKGDITEENISKNLYTENQSDPDIVIRTGGEMRISNFLIWQSAYSEFYFPKTYWPDFNSKELKKALKEFANRKRRYGK